MCAPDENNSNTRHERGWVFKTCVAAIPIFVTIGLFYASSVIGGHQHDLDVKQTLVASISSAESDASSTALEFGTGDIVNEATSSVPAIAVIQQRSDQALRDWRQVAGLAQIQIDTYYRGQAKKALDKALTYAERVVEDLIYISGLQLKHKLERVQMISDLQNKLAHQPRDPTNQQWATLDDSPTCFLVGTVRCPTGFEDRFTASSEALIADIRTYLLNGLITDIEQNSTVFQPTPCRYIHVCSA